MEPRKIRSSRQWNQSSCSHWWINSQFSDRFPHLPCYIIYFQLWGDQQDRPREKRSQYDGSIRPRLTPSLTNRGVRKGEIICKIRMPYNLRHHDDDKSNHPSFTNGNFQWWRHRVETTIRRPQDVGEIQIVFTPSASRLEKSGNNRRKGGVHCDSTKHLRCTTSLSRRSPWGDLRHSNNYVWNANTRLRYGRTGTSQCSPYKLELRGNGTVGTYDCDHERHAGSTKNTHLCTNQPSEAKNKVLMLELREQFRSREQNLLIKEIGTSRGSVIQEKNGWQWKGVLITVRGDRW